VARWRPGTLSRRDLVGIEVAIDRPDPVTVRAVGLGLSQLKSEAKIKPSAVTARIKKEPGEPNE